jgi:low temperature requirement protein LtrA
VSNPETLTRNTGTHDHVPAGFAELFFDLVYVFAITQLSHYLLAHHDKAGLAQTAIMFFAIWWAWTYTAWATNWLDPDRVPVRLLIFAMMLAGLVMSASIPKAFGDRALWFALAYVAVQVGRTLFVILAVRGERPKLGLSMTRALCWFLFSAPLWIGGAFADPSMRLLFWSVALAIEYLGPAAQFAVPGLGRSTTSDYEVTGAHMAERCGLLIIIALGEGILVTGATFAGLAWDGATVAALAIAFAGSALMWWVYFDVGMKRGADHIAHHRDSGRVARNAYTYAHVPIVAGIVVTAMADELLLAHPTGHAGPALILSSAGVMALFLGGTMLFKKTTSRSPWWPLSHLVGLGLLAALAIVAWLLDLPPLAIGAASAGVMLVVAIWEWGSFHGGWVHDVMPVGDAEVPSGEDKS